MLRPKPGIEQLRREEKVKTAAKTDVVLRRFVGREVGTGAITPG